MSTIKINKSSMQNIADAIRDKNHEVVKYYPSEMSAAISRIKTVEPVFDKLTVTENGKYTPPAEIDGYNEVDVNVQPNLTSINITANGQYTPTDTDGFNEVNVAVEGVPTDAELQINNVMLQWWNHNGQWDWFINKYGSRITTHNLEGLNEPWAYTKLETFPFELNMKPGVLHTMYSAFKNCKELKTLPKINGCKPRSISSIFQGCNSLLEIPADFESSIDWSYIENLTDATAGYFSGWCSNMFNECRSLRTVPCNIIKHVAPNVTSGLSSYGNNYYYTFYGTISADELVDIGIAHNTATTDVFTHTFWYGRQKNIKFETNEDGSAKTVNWKSQVINLGEVGFENNSSDPITYGEATGITYRTRVTNNTTYQNLKNNPNWWTTDPNYSRYDHDSAVATINSLPDTSAYLATAGGTNTIQFRSNSGRYTDGGAISNLTAEEIAVATAKGWTVALF